METRAQRYARWANESRQNAADCWTEAERLAGAIRRELASHRPHDGWLGRLRERLIDTQYAALNQEGFARKWAARAAEQTERRSCGESLANACERCGFNHCTECHNALRDERCAYGRTHHNGQLCSACTDN